MRKERPHVEIRFGSGRFIETERMGRRRVCQTCEARIEPGQAYVEVLPRGSGYAHLEHAVAKKGAKRC